MHIHLGQRQLQGPLGARAFFQALRIEAALTHLGDGDGDLAQARGERFVFVTIGMARACLRALMRSCSEVFLPLEEHGGVQEDAEKIR